MEERLDDAIHVLRNHAEPVAHDSHLPPTARLTHSHSMGSDASSFSRNMGSTHVQLVSLRVGYHSVEFLMSLHVRT